LPAAVYQQLASGSLKPRAHGLICACYCLVKDLTKVPWIQASLEQLLWIFHLLKVNSDLAVMLDY